MGDRKQPTPCPSDQVKPDPPPAPPPRRDDVFRSEYDRGFVDGYFAARNVDKLLGDRTP